MEPKAIYTILVLVIVALIGVIIYRRKNQTPNQQVHEKTQEGEFVQKHNQPQNLNRFTSQSGTLGQFEMTHNNTNVQTWEKPMSLR